MQIRSLVVTKRPQWVNVHAGFLERIEFSAKVDFWPENERGVALFLIEFDDAPTETLLAEHGITMSAIGAYVYLKAPVQSGEFQQAISLPRAKVKRIGIRLWKSQTPILLEEVTVTASGAEVSSEYATSNRVLLNDFDDFKQGHRPNMLPLNLMAHGAECNAYCHAICQNWYETMDDVARRHRDNDVGRINCSFRLENGSQVPMTLYNGTPAMLRIPESHANYLEKIGDKARNMIRKAQRQGYAYRKVNPDDYLDDVLAVRTSDPERQGKPIPDYYKVRPVQMIDEPFRNGCSLHGEDFFGVFKDGKLVAYTTIFFYGELGQVNHILGHAEHLQEGVMNLLVSEMVREVIAHRSWVRAINYLYPHGSKVNTGIGLFKRSIGFQPERVLVTHAGPDLKQYFSGHGDDSEPKPYEPPSEKKALRATTSKAVKAAVSTDDFIHPERAKSRGKAVDLALTTLNENNPALKLLRYKKNQGPVEADFDASLAHALVFDEIAFGSFQEFLSSGLKGFRKVIPKDSFLLFDFKRVPDRKHVIGTPGFARMIPRLLQPKGMRINHELVEYLSKRFKSLDLSIDDVRTGFKGSDYVVAGIIDYENKKKYHSFDSLLILRKIR